MCHMHSNRMVQFMYPQKIWHDISINILRACVVKISTITQNKYVMVTIVTTNKMEIVCAFVSIRPYVSCIICYKKLGRWIFKEINRQYVCEAMCIENNQKCENNKGSNQMDISILQFRFSVLPLVYMFDNSVCNCIKTEIYVHKMVHSHFSIMYSYTVCRRWCSQIHNFIQFVIYGNV